MKKIIVLVLSALFFVSCVNDDSFPKTENITKGTKWNLRIGSSPMEVYKQLQDLGIEKNFDAVNINYRLPYSKPEDIKSDLSLYRSITIDAPSGRIERVLIQFDQNKVEAIEKGGGLLDPITKWPENMSDQNTINLNDPIDGIQQKLVAIYQNPTYENYKITLSNKWLQKAFDPDMSNFKEWSFTFSTDVSSSKGGRSDVTLYFKNGKLIKIRNTYEEFEIVY
jgi:hypothetical protein